MKVIDFTNNDFVRFSCELKKLISPTQPVVVIGVANGGVPLADHFSKYLSNNHQNSVSSFVVKCQRNSTKPKSSSLGKAVFSIIQFFPKIILNYARVIEFYMLNRSKGKLSQRVVVDSTIPNNYDLSSSIVVIIDDAIDSGSSIVAVKSFLEEQYRLKEVLVATVVVTTSSPLINPNFSLYSNVLVRFPWSKDSKVCK